MNASIIPFETTQQRGSGVCFIERTSIAGTAHVPGIRHLAQRLVRGESLVLKRDAQNRHDVFAVSVQDARGNSLGYLSCEHNEIVSRLLAGGKHVSGLVRSVSQVGRWTKIEMAVILND